MELLEKMHDELLRERGRGTTNQEMARRAGISQPHINFLLNSGADSLGSLKFRSVLKLFPHLEAQMERYYSCARADNGSVAEVVGTGRAEADHNSRATVTTPDGRLDDALDAVLEDSSMCDTCKMAAIRHIRDVAKRA